MAIMKGLFLLLLSLLSMQSACALLPTPQTALEGALHHTALIDIVEDTLRTTAPKDIAEYTLMIVDAAEMVCAPGDKNCLREVHKSIIFGVVNQHTVTQALHTARLSNAVASLTPVDMPDDLTRIVNGTFESLAMLDSETVEGTMGLIEGMRKPLFDTLDQEEYEVDSISHHEIVVSTTSVAMESARQWIDIANDKESPFYTSFDNIICYGNSPLHEKGRLGQGNRRTQLQVILLPAFLAVIPIFDVLGGYVALTASSRTTLRGIMTTAAYFSLFGPFTCVVDIVKCVPVVIEMLDGDFEKEELLAAFDGSV